MTPDRAAALKLVQLLAAFLSGKLDREDLGTELVKAANVIKRSLPAKPLQLTPDHAVQQDAVCERVLALWCQVMGQQCKLTTGRRQKLVARLKSYSEAQIIQAVRGCATSDFHMGRNDSKARHNDLMLICRSDEKLDEFIRRATEQGIGLERAAKTLVKSREDEKLSRDAADALTRGDMQAYERINGQIAAARQRTG